MFGLYEPPPPLNWVNTQLSTTYNQGQWWTIWFKIAYKNYINPNKKHSENVKVRMNQNECT